MITYEHVARPTLYQGRSYRSRLEARWAAFFDALGWHYEYEPFDLRGWVPDFVLIGKTENILVEVKPITHYDKDVGQKITRGLSPGQEALLVGCCLPASWEPDRPCVGWLVERWAAGDDYPAGCGSNPAPFAWYDAKPAFADFTSESGGWSGRLTGEYDGGCWGGAPPRADQINEAWGAAAWQVQWRRP